MHLDDIFFQIMIYLLAAVISVPIAKKIGFGSVLGYLLAGIVIGPFVLNMLGSNGESVMHFAEFGVVIMLFIVGLELHPSTLWRMKRLIFGMGGMQIGFTALIFSTMAAFFWLNMAQAITTGLILALSSTAIVLQTLSEKGLLQTRGGRHSFSVLLMQDISVVPIFAVIALLAQLVTDNGAGTDAAEATSSGWMQLLIILGAVGVIIAGGRYLAHYIFRFIAETGLRELFTATALLLVIGIAVFMDAVGLSPALGTFLAGVVLANSEYRYELEDNLEPFKGLLLGVFFISVGASINFELLFNHWGLIVGLLIVVVVVKLIVLYSLGRMFKLNQSHNVLFAFSLAQAGEFGFVLISFATQNAIYDAFTSGVLMIVVALSMAITPLLFIINEHVVQPRLNKKVQSDEVIEESDGPIIIAGFGRFGQVLGRFLNANGIKATIIDNNPHNVKYLKKFGYKLYYGDITRKDMLEAAGAAQAKVLVVSMQERHQIDKVVEVATKHYPHLKLIVRAVDIAHELALQNKAVDALRQETFDSAIQLGTDALRALGVNKYQSYRSAVTFKNKDKKFMESLQQRYSKDDPHFAMETKRFSEHLENILLMQQRHTVQDFDSAWDTFSMIEEAQEADDNQLSDSK
ncbi:MAG: monovalent cation:proton antiporter-2 (CPA2) family protein [Carboxylicivirga sp.]|jgi:monovalent cation:proton antiporter-2 (CPA2) family protein|nr:monovalent cation:proton antiporter-2 (CPA2) family protein [Carboxylicivirga sp.]